MLIKLSGKWSKEKGNENTIVDDIDSDLANTKWCVEKKHGLYYVRHNHTSMHRMILERKLGRSLKPKEMSDHKNGNGLDNRRDNLRPCNHQQNMRNRGKNSRNTTGYQGVVRGDREGTWKARIEVNGKHFSKRGFPTPESAALFYDELAREHFGEFAFQNFPGGDQQKHQQKHQLERRHQLEQKYQLERRNKLEQKRVELIEGIRKADWHSMDIALLTKVSLLLQN